MTKLNQEKAAETISLSEVYKQALAAYSQASQIYKTVEDSSGEAKSFARVGDAKAWRVKRDDTMREKDDPIKLPPPTTEDAAVIAAYQEALDAYQKALDIHEQTGDLHQKAELWIKIGDAHLSMGETIIHIE